MIGRILAIVALVLLNGFFVAAEFAVVRSRRARLEAMVRLGTRGARYALRATDDLGRMLSASQLGITLSSIGLGWVAERTLNSVMQGPAALLMPSSVAVSLRVAAAAMIALGVVSYLHVVFGELAPRAAALQHPESFARWLAPPLLAFAWMMRPFIALVNGSASIVLRAMGHSGEQGVEHVHSPDELRMLVEQSQEGGALQTRDADLIDGVFEFSEKTAREVMTPRTAIVAISSDASLEEAVDAIVEGGFSRYPVYDESIDNIVGLVHAKELLPVLRRPPAEFDLRTIMRDVHVVPGSREVEDVLADFKRRREIMAVVLDEYGGTAGVVTMEDLLEEIVGEIRDEYDDAEAAPLVASPGEAWVLGSMHVSELNERYGLAVPDEDHTTIGGFVFGSLGRLPTVNDRVTAGGAVFKVREMHGRRIETLAVDLCSVGDRRAMRRDEVGEKTPHADDH